MNILPLNKLPIGTVGEVVSINPEMPQRRRMLDLGLVSGTKVQALQKSPSGDPVAYFFRGSVIALRKEDADKIIVQFA